MNGNKLSVKEKIGYGMGDAGCNIIFGAIMLFVNYFYTDIFGLAPALVGALLLRTGIVTVPGEQEANHRAGDGRPYPQ